MSGLSALSACSKKLDPTKASLPLSAVRNGFVCGEGGGACILESLEHAQKRGAKILGVVVCYGALRVAYHKSAPVPSGSQAARAMQCAV